MRQVADDRKGIFDQAFQGADHGRFDLVNIVGHAGDKVSLPSFREIPDGQGQYFFVYIIAKERNGSAAVGGGDIRRPVIKNIFKDGAYKDKNADGNQSPDRSMGIDDVFVKSFYRSDSIEIY